MVYLNSILRMLLLLACLAGAALRTVPAFGSELVKIGILAFRPKQQTQAQWGPLAVALKRALPERDFVVEALTYPEMDRAIASRQLDFLLTNPGHYVQLKRRCGLSSPLATLAVDEGGHRSTVFGGVIFSRMGQPGISTLSDLRGRTIASPSTESLGGYQMQAYELSQAGIRLPEDVTLITTGLPHDNTVEAVLSGRADAGFVRSGTLEGMAREGKLDLDRVRILNRQYPAGFQTLTSTRLYPEWPFLAMPNVDERVARHVAAALFNLSGDTPETRAMGIQGFGVPADYTPVEDLLRELRLPPFDSAPRFTLQDVWSRYHWPTVGVLLALGLILALAFRLHLANRELDAESRTVMQQQAEMREAMAEKSALISAIPDLVYTTRRDGAFQFAHVPDSSLPWLSRESFLHRRPEEVFDGSFAEQLRQAYGDALDSGQIQEVNHRPPADSGGRSYEARVAPCTEDTVITIVRDVTERQRAEVALLASRELFSKAFSTSPDAININRLEDGVYITVNEGFTKTTGYAPEDVLGRPSVAEECPLWVDPVDRERLIAGLRETGEVTGFEAPFRMKDGRHITGLMSAKIIEIDGELNIISITRDITALKQNEADKAELQAQLQHAQKMESLGILAGGVAHDMNNVLGAILGLASAHIDTQPPGSVVHRAFGTIIKAAERGGTLVKSLLSFARRSPAESAELDMNAVLREELQILERTTLAKVDIVLDLTPDLPLIHGDASALTHAFMNLCVNAVDAMTEAGTLTLRTRNLGDRWVEVEVEDTGSGMSKEILAKAMDPFFTTKEIGKGTGLGLSMVYSTVKAHQGLMDIQSRPGQGTRVKMRFPASVNLHPGPASAANQPLDQNQRALAVLLVDDDELIQSSMQAILEVLGHQVTTAWSGEGALAAIQAGFEPDVVILDMNMPGLGGAGTLPQLRALRPAMPVLLATGRADQTALDLVESHPQVSLLTKPYSMNQLQQHLEQLELVTNGQC